MLVWVALAELVGADHMVHAGVKLGYQGIDHRGCNWAVQEVEVFGATTLAQDEESLTVIGVKQIRARQVSQRDVGGGAELTDTDSISNLTNEIVEGRMVVGVVTDAASALAMM